MKIRCLPSALHLAATRCFITVGAVFLGVCTGHAQTACLLGKVSAHVVDSGFVYLSEPYPSCHASTVVDTGDGLLAAWFGGSFEKHPDVCIYGAFYKHGVWEKPFRLADGIEYELLRNPCWNPVLYKRANGDVLLYYKVGPSPSKWYGAYKVSADGGKTWSDEQRIPHNLLGPIKNKPVCLPNGRILYPTSVEDDLGWRVYLEHSKQDLSDWTKITIDNAGFDAIQPSVLVYKNGWMQLLCRSKNKRLVQSWSHDGGISWTPIEATQLPNNNSGTDALTLADQETQLLVYNPLTEGRHKLALAVSFDGLEWKDVLMLEDRPVGEFSYPAIVEGADGKIYITYTYNRKRIKYAVVELKST